MKNCAEVDGLGTLDEVFGKILIGSSPIMCERYDEVLAKIYYDDYKYLFLVKDVKEIVRVDKTLCSTNIYPTWPPIREELNSYLTAHEIRATTPP